MTSTVISALVPLLSVLLGALVTYRVNVRTRRRSAAEEIVNAAISAVAVSEANQSRSGRVNLPADFDSSDAQDLRRRIILGAIENHNIRSHEAREALAKVVVLDGRVRQYYLDPDAVFDRPQAIIRELTNIRNRIIHGKNVPRLASPSDSLRE
jgi:hypothetical protein